MCKNKKAHDYGLFLFFCNKILHKALTIDYIFDKISMFDCKFTVLRLNISQMETILFTKYDEFHQFAVFLWQVVLV